MTEQGDRLHLWILAFKSFKIVMHFELAIWSPKVDSGQISARFTEPPNHFVPLRLTPSSLSLVFNTKFLFGTAGIRTSRPSQPLDSPDSVIPLADLRCVTQQSAREGE